MMVRIYYNYNQVLCLVHIQSHSRICLYVLILLYHVLPDTLNQTITGSFICLRWDTNHSFILIQTPTLRYRLVKFLYTKSKHAVNLGYSATSIIWTLPYQMAKWNIQITEMPAFLTWFTWYRRLWLLPRAHAQGVKQSVLSVVVVTKIARSWVLGICACCNYHELEISTKNWFLCTSNYWTRLTSATNRAFSVQHACGLPTTPTALHMPCADMTRLRMLDLNEGESHQDQVMKCIQLQCFTTSYNSWRAHRVCALESSS